MVAEALTLELVWEVAEIATVMGNVPVVGAI
jgi:hypothetical protein